MPLYKMLYYPSLSGLLFPLRTRTKKKKEHPYMQIPPFQPLRPGDAIALITPAAGAHPKAVQVLIDLLHRAGLAPFYQPEMNDEGSAPYAHQYERMPSASSDANRLMGFQAALNSEAKAIWTLHGGQGCEKIVSALERDLLTLSPLPQGWPCLHGLVGTVSEETYDITHMPINKLASLQKLIEALMGQTKTLSYSLTPLNEAAQQGPAIEKTTIVGGALHILITHAGTSTALRGEGNIIFIEEPPERPERVETLFMGLIRSGTFKKAKALILGSFSDPTLNEARFKTVKPILLQRLVDLLQDHEGPMPIFHADNFGHGEFNDPLPLGTQARILPGESPVLTVEIY